MQKNNKVKRKNNKINVGAELAFNHAITLISLVITIIVLIILAGVSINLSLGNNGIFTRAKQVKEKYLEEFAREKLETVLMEAKVEKETNKNYNNIEFLNEMLKSNEMEVIEENVIVDNYNFVIDRERLIIAKSLGKTKITVTKEVQKYLGKNENNKYVANTLVKIESNLEIEKITFINPDKTETTSTIENTKFEKNIDVEFDEEYKVKVKTKDGKEETRTLIEKSKEKIRNLEEFLAFRDKVNSGLTYEGKNLKLTTDIDLTTVCGEKTGSFEPIGNKEKIFKGIFDGNDHLIQNIFINKTADCNGLFGYILNAEIKNVKLDNGNISGGYRTGGICAYATGSTIFNCHNNARITGNQAHAGGICGTIASTTIEQCSNKVKISRASLAGGIVGASLNGGNVIKNCFNIGEINSVENFDWGNNPSYAGGIIGMISGEKNANAITKVENCYNMGNIIGKRASGGICACQAYGGNNFISNCYSIGSISGDKKNGISSGENQIRSYFKGNIK